jgi:GDPmannose 4,6-dehydratase
MSNRIALVTGITGQDGSYLAELLLSKGYYVHGLIRKSSTFNTSRIDHIYGHHRLWLHYGDLTDSMSIDDVVKNVMPDEIYHLGAQSHVKVSFEMPAHTSMTDAMGTLYLLDAMRRHCPSARMYNATTSELYGKIQEEVQNETTPFYPRSPYGVAKLYSYWIAKNYRESYGLFVSNGILFNHESERRGSTFVTKKITEGLAEYVRSGRAFYLGNINSKRDWGYAPDFVEGMWKILDHPFPDDFVLATGETHTIKEFVDECVSHLPNNEKYHWKVDFLGREVLKDDDKLVIGIDERYYRPAEVDVLLGDYSKAKELLGWEPKVTFRELAKKMMLNDLNIK